MIAILDYGVGNIGSIRNMLSKIGVPSELASHPSDLDRAKKIIIPGVGAFGAGMAALRQSGFEAPLREKAFEEKTPILGICLGMQLLARGSEEGNEKGLGWLPCQVVRFSNAKVDTDIKIPHMGWNVVRPVKNAKLFTGMEGELRYYFVHSYHMVCDNEETVLGLTPYGGEFVSVVGRDNILGVQFHPEKSHHFGMALLKNFSELY